MFASTPAGPVVVLCALLVALGTAGCGGTKHKHHHDASTSTSSRPADPDAAVDADAEELAQSLKGLSTATATTPAPATSDGVASAYASAYADVVKSSNELVTDFDAARSAGDVATVKAKAADLRDAVFGWDGSVRDLDFPAAARADLDALLEQDRSTIARLDAVSGASEDAVLSQATADELRAGFDAVTKAAVRLGGDVGLSTS